MQARFVSQVLCLVSCPFASNVQGHESVNVQVCLSSINRSFEGMLKGIHLCHPSRPQLSVPVVGGML